VRVSIVTPSFRNSDWLKLCIASVADQGGGVEHLVQDGGSDDGTLDWLPQDSRVQAFVEKDAGMYDAINRGLRRASGDLLGYLNCDEQYLPGALNTVRAFFTAHPEVDMLFGDVVVVDGQGDYLFHRKMVTPRLAHTWVCHLSTLTCATFFRRRLLTEMNLYFDPAWRAIGDGVWMMAALQRGVRMATLGQFTSTFTNTGGNLSLNPKAMQEAERFAAQAPSWMRMNRPLLKLHHRARRWAAGVYSQPPFAYSIFTPASPALRVVHHVTAPTGRWKW
jgi:glycosyltransferase involved in cell wall biosynthesis